MLLLGAICSADTTTLDLGPIPESLQVAEVVVSGNEETKDFVILREMSLVEGSIITQERLDYDRDRIYSLGIFNRVTLTPVPLPERKARLNVVVEERWFIFPFPIFGLRDRDWSKIYYGAGLAHSNFRGRNEKIFASAVFGYDPAFTLYYRNSFLDDEGRYFTDARLSYTKVRNRSPEVTRLYGDYDEEHFSATVGPGRRFGTTHSLWLTLGYRSVVVPNDTILTTASGSGSDRFPLTGIGWAYDTRDLREYPSAGSMVQVTVSKSGFPGMDVDFTRVGTDLRHYLPLPASLVLAGRLFTDFAAGESIPAYGRVYFGYGERIRGHFDEVVEGDNLAGFTTELHYPLFGPRYFQVDFLPRAFGLWKFGVTAALFYNAGTVWFKDARFDEADVLSGYGGGIHVLLPYSIVVRAEYAWSETGHPQFIFDIGGSF